MLFFFLAALLCVGTISLISTELPLPSAPRQEGKIISVGDDCRYFKTSLRRYSAWGEGFSAQTSTGRDIASFTSLQTESPLSPIPLPDEESSNPITYSGQFPLTLPSANRSDTMTTSLPPVCTEIFLLHFPSSWGSFISPPVAEHNNAPEWKGLQSSFIVSLDNEGKPDCLILTQSSGNTEADQAATAYLRTARWAHSHSVRNAPIIVSWKEATP